MVEGEKTEDVEGSKLWRQAFSGVEKHDYRSQLTGVRALPPALSQVNRLCRHCVT